MKPRAFCLAAPLVLAACASAPVDDGPAPQCTSLLGRPLYAPELAPERRAALEEDLARAEATLAQHPESEEAVIWVGRRRAYLGDYRAAVETFSAGLALHPWSYRLLRHRGHRWITLRELDRAVDDLTLAAWRSRNAPDAVEPDGAPNAAGLPRGTDQTSIHYHLGLAHYLRGELAAALAAWDRCKAHAGNDDMLVATEYWRYLALRRLGRDDEAALVLAPIHGGMEILENHAYRDLLLFFRGDLSERRLLTRLEAGVGAPTVLYGVGCWHLVEGRPERARALFEPVVAGDTWPAFGFIAAEAELARMQEVAR